MLTRYVVAEGLRWRDWGEGLAVVHRASSDTTHLLEARALRALLALAAASDGVSCGSTVDAQADDTLIAPLLAAGLVRQAGV